MALLCPYCFQSTGLRRRLVEIRPQFDEGPCDYHPRRKGIPIEEVAQIIDEVFRANYTFGDAEYFDQDDPDERGYYGKQRGDSLEEIIYSITDPENDDIAQAVIQQIIEDDDYWPPDGDEPFYLEDVNYERITNDDQGHGRTWEQFCHTVTHEQRFMNPNVAELLGEIFKYIHLQQDNSRLHPVYTMRPSDGHRIFRARTVGGDEARQEIQQDVAGQLGPPPRRLGKPNRMNPSGITAFYGAFDLQTCISELRPRVGEEVVGAEFELIRDVVVLDTTRFAAPPKELNLFARDHVRRLAQWRFMQRFMGEIAKPISKEDEHLDYVPTQVVAEFLNQVHEVTIGKAKRRIDAILYKSAQRPNGINIVLLGSAAQVDGVKKSRAVSNFASFGLPMRDEPSIQHPALKTCPDTLRSITIGSAEFGIDRDMRLPLLSSKPKSSFDGFGRVGLSVFERPDDESF